MTTIAPPQPDVSEHEQDTQDAEQDAEWQAPKRVRKRRWRRRPSEEEVARQMRAPAAAPPPSPRAQRVAQDRAWPQHKRELLAAVRALREEVEPGLRTPDLARAALFTMPRGSEMPSRPRFPRPAPNDKSEAAAARRRAWATFDHFDVWRKSSREAHRMRPNNTWRRATSGGERGGQRPGMQAWPEAWTGYLLRVDPDRTDAPFGGDGWGSLLGRALRRVERAYRDTPLWRALWLATDPRSVMSAVQIAAELTVSTGSVYRWVEASTRRLWAEVETIAAGDGKSGRSRAWRERSQAEEAEATAWRWGAAGAAPANGS